MKLKPPGRLNANDYPRIVALWQAAGLHIRPKGRDSREAFERQLESGIQKVIGIETRQGDLIGVVLVTHDSRKGLINRLAVHPDWRRRGLAKNLITAAEDLLHEQGIDVTAVLIEPENPASLKLFQETGYYEWTGM
ncbi:MAG: GNAT family N-acetyltransferase, partial [Desulfobacteraceae bacterium]